MASGVQMHLTSFRSSFEHGMLVPEKRPLSLWNTPESVTRRRMRR